MLINWLSTSGWISKYAASGHKIYLEDGNEAWNSGCRRHALLRQWHGLRVYAGPKWRLRNRLPVTTPMSIKLVGNSWVAPNQGYGQLRVGAQCSDSRAGYAQRATGLRGRCAVHAELPGQFRYLRQQRGHHRSSIPGRMGGGCESRFGHHAGVEQPSRCI